jgi:hypothetical protein
MRWVNIGVIVALVAVILIFALQNLESVTMSFLGFRISAPLACRRPCSLPPGHGDRRKRVGAGALGLAGAKGNIGLLI